MASPHHWKATKEQEDGSKKQKKFPSKKLMLEKCWQVVTRLSSQVRQLFVSKKANFIWSIPKIHCGGPCISLLGLPYCLVVLPLYPGYRIAAPCTHILLIDDYVTK